MFELLKTSVTGVNLIPTTLLGLVVLYWITVIIGALDIDFLDIDLDADTDLDTIPGPFYGLLVFLNFGELPFMLVLSIIILPFWVLSMLMHLLPFETGGWVSAVLLIPNLFISMFIAKGLSNPLKKFFDEPYKNKKESTIEGTLCTLLCNLSYERLGQAEVQRDTACIKINVKLEEPEDLKKGDRAIILKKDAEKDFYFIKKFEGVR